MEDPVGWHPETTSEFPFKSELQQKIEDHTHQGLRLLYENQDNIEIKEKAEYLLEILFDADQLSTQPKFQIYSQRLFKRAEELYRSLTSDKAGPSNAHESLSQEATQLFVLDNVDSSTFIGK